ncbi:hypothetical protein AAVH_13502 [Aphelenchoides avenae]|nr:hypothetical protein AAVH_13502 [Aphelenchus avenae]
MQVQFPPYEGLFSTTVLAPRRHRPYEQCAFKADTLCSVPETDGIDVFASEPECEDATIGYESREDAVMARLQELSGLFFCYGELCEVRLKSETPEPLRRIVKPMPIDANNATELPPRNVSGSTWLCWLATMLLYALLLIFCAAILTVVYVASTTFVWLQLWLLDWVVYFAKQLLLDQIKAALVNWIRPRASAWLTTFFPTASDPAEVVDADEIDGEPGRSADDENWTWLFAAYEWWTFETQHGSREN